MVRRASSTTRRLKDKWRAKKWYTVLAPDIFNNKPLMETLADDPKKLVGRTLEVSLSEITDDLTKMHVKLKFRIVRTRASEALTVFEMQSLTSDYVRRMTRRRHSKIDAVFDLTTKDGYKVRLKPMAVTDRRIQSSQKKKIRAMMKEYLKEFTETHTMSELVNAVLDGTIRKGIIEKSKPIYILKRVVVRKTEILARGKPEELPPEPEEEVMEKKEELKGVEVETEEVGTEEDHSGEEEVEA